MNAEWYVSQNGRQLGPFSPNQLQQMASDGKLKPDDLVTQVGAKQWTPAKQVKGLTFATASVQPALPPLPPQLPPLPAAPLPPTAAPSSGDSVNAPAIILAVYGIVYCLVAFVGLAFSLMMWDFGSKLQKERNPDHPAFAYGTFPEMVVRRAQFGFANGVVGCGFGVVILTGAVMMKRLRYHGVALAAAVLALLPNCACCALGMPVSVADGEPTSPQLQFWLIIGLSLLSTPLGLWCLIVLNRSDVKASSR